MTTALATTNGNQVAQVHLGERDAIAQIRDRIVSMMPGAADAPADVVWAAAQLAVAHELNPFNGEIYIMSTGKKNVNGQWVDDYRAHVGVKGLRKKAREQAEFMTEFRDMADDEVKRYRRNDYDPDDVGVECILYRLDTAQTCARIGIPYKPVIAVGFWRKRAKYNKRDKKWMPDNTPNTWTDHQVAKKRAEINAIKEAFDLTINVADPATAGDTVDVLSHRIEAIERDESMPVAAGSADDDCLFIVDEEPIPDDRWDRADEADAAAYDSDAKWEAIPDKDESQASASAKQPVPPGRDYAQLRDKLTGQAKEFIDWAAGLHMDPKDGACTEAQYRFLFSLFRDLAGKGREEAAMEVVFNDRIDADNRPGFKITKQLLDFLPATRGKGEKKTENENHRADICGIIEVIGQMVKEADSNG